MAGDRGIGSKFHMWLFTVNRWFQYLAKNPLFRALTVDFFAIL